MSGISGCGMRMMPLLEARQTRQLGDFDQGQRFRRSRHASWAASPRHLGEARQLLDIGYRGMPGRVAPHIDAFAAQTAVGLMELQ
jgi:hypothetical protein